MRIKRVLLIEDSIEKYMDIYQFLKNKMNISEIEWVKNSEQAITAFEKAEREGKPYNVLFSDMNFEFQGKDDIEAGEKTMKLLRKKGYNVPVIFCSSQNWKTPGAVGNVFYNTRRDWESEAEELLKNI